MGVHMYADDVTGTGIVSHNCDRLFIIDSNFLWKEISIFQLKCYLNIHILTTGMPPTDNPYVIIIHQCSSHCDSSHSPYYYYYYYKYFYIPITPVSTGRTRDSHTLSVKLS